jgi:predicted metal-dependent phosphoesterase TrpH
MLIEMHSHTNKHSKCSIISPVDLIKAAVEKGLQGLVITEHHYLWTQQELSELRQQSEISDSFLLLSAQEVETDTGHVLVYGAGETIGSSIKLEELRKNFPEAALVWAHPFRNGAMPGDDRLLRPEFDAIEIFSTNHTLKENYTALKTWHRLKFNAVSGSDTHTIDKASAIPTQFDHPFVTMKELVSELKHNHAKPFFKEIPKSGSNLSVTEITFGTKGDSEERERIILKKYEKKDKWLKALETTKLVKTLYSSGFGAKSSLRVPAILDIDERENIIIETSQRGKNLYDVISNVAAEAGLKYFTLTARWLAALHSLKLKTYEIESSMTREEKRFQSYKKAFIDTRNPLTDKALKLIEFITKIEPEVIEQHRQQCVTIHGDFHPKNVIIGQDITHDPSTLYVSVIDFDSAMLFHPAFEVAYFLTQFRSQFRSRLDILKIFNDSVFLNAYTSALPPGTLDDFSLLVDIFKIRTSLSIASFFIKVGKGESNEVADLINGSLMLKDLVDKKL